MIGVWIAVALIAAAVLILGRRLVDFVRTGGESACKNCPYSGNCGGGCNRKK